MLTYNPDPLKTNQRLQAPEMRKLLSFFDFFEQFRLRGIAKIFKENSEVLMNQAFESGSLEKQCTEYMKIKQVLVVTIFCGRTEWVDRVCKWANAQFYEGGMKIIGPQTKATYLHGIHHNPTMMEVGKQKYQVAPPMLIAVALGKLNVVTMLINNGFSVTYSKDIILPLSGKWVKNERPSPLALAVKLRATEIVKTLLETKADVYDRGPFGAMDMAIKHNDQTMMKLLNKYNPHHGHFEDAEADEISEDEEDEIAKTLLAHKANPEHSNNAPLRAAIKRGDRDLCHLLMDSGAASFLAAKEEKKETKGV